jgi:hypothetical protein
MEEENICKCGEPLKHIPYKDGERLLIINGKETNEIDTLYCIFCNDVRIKRDEKLYKYNSFGQIIRISEMKADVKVRG